MSEKYVFKELPSLVKASNMPGGKTSVKIAQNETNLGAIPMVLIQKLNNDDKRNMCVRSHGISDLYSLWCISC